jgi:hypothetical protein
MTSENPAPRSLRDMGMEVLAEGREWMRQRLEQKLRAAAERHGGVFPLSGRKAWHRRSEPMQLRTVVGTVQLSVWHGQDPRDRHWGCPMRERWDLRAQQQMSPAWEEKLAFTATLAGSYEDAALLAGKRGCPADDSVLRTLVQRLGGRAEAQTQVRLKIHPGREPAATAGQTEGGRGLIARKTRVGWTMPDAMNTGTSFGRPFNGGGVKMRTAGRPG